MESQTLSRTPTGPHPHELHLVPHHWTHASSLSPFSTQHEYAARTENNYPLVPPTRAEYLAGGKRYRWTARAHRKGVPPRLVREQDNRELGGFAALVEREGKQWWNLVWKIRWWGWDFGDISWWVAFLFTLGSVFWCIQGIQVFCYPNNTTTVFTNTEAAIAFLGGTTFLIGGYLGYVESLNPAFADWDGAFAYEVEEVLGKRELAAKASGKSSPSSDLAKISSPTLPRWLPPPPSHSTSTSTRHDTQSHHHPTLGKRRRHFGSHAPPPPPPPPAGLNKKASSSPSRPPSSSSTAASAQTTLLSPASSSSPASATQPTPSQSPCCRPSRPQWKWFGVPPPHKRLDLGFLANAIQLFGAVAFEVSVICGLPGVLGASGAVGGVEQEGRVEREWIAAYWAMQILGSPCFTFAGLVFALETQTRWYKPNLVSIGWWIGIWNVIGGFGFWFCGIFGVWRQTDISNPEHYQRWGTAFSTFWGSWAFLIGSYIQMLETLNKWT